MRYFYQRKRLYTVTKGFTYECKHPVYDRCTLYLQENKGLAIIQQRFDSDTKRTWWGDIDPWLIDDLYSQPGFSIYFEKYARESGDGLYPTVCIRQIMWALKMKPLKKDIWETAFDHCPV